MPDFTDFFDDAFFAPTLPDYAILGGRLYVVDGINPNICFDGHDENTRIMGAFPQFVVPTIAFVAGANLMPKSDYTWAVTRVIKIGSLTVESQYVLNTATSGDTADPNRSATIEIETYEYPPQAGAGYTVHYRIYRNQAGNADFLFLVEELTQAQFNALPVGSGPEFRLYADTDTDAMLDQAFILDVTFPVSQENLFLFPVRFIRTFRNRLIAAGSVKYDIGSVTIVGGNLDEVVVNAPGAVRETDIEATFLLDDDKFAYTVIRVDIPANKWILDRDVENAVTAVPYALFRPFDTVYTLNPLPGNIEGWFEGTEVITNPGSGNPITGIAVAGNYCYIFHKFSVEILDEAGGVYQIVPLLSGVGCRGHQTIADRYSRDKVFFYAGEQGVWVIEDTNRRPIHEKIRRIFDERIDHSLDEYCHGIWNPQTGLYHLWVFERGDTAAIGVRVPQLLLTWDDRLEQWYEYKLAASTSTLWLSPEGRLVPVIGIAGAVAQIEVTNRDGADHAGTFGTGDTINPDNFIDITAVFPTADSGLAGMPIYIIYTDGTRSRRIIRTNTDSQVWIYGEWDPAPVALDRYHIGAIEWLAETKDMEFFPRLDRDKKAWRLEIIHDNDTAENKMEVELKGVRTTATKNVKEEREMNGYDVSRFEGKLAGLRSRAFRTRMDGCNTRPVKIITVNLESVETTR
jgi:hypothetical protein